MSTNMANNQYCGFKIGDDEYGIAVLEVQEVIKPQPVTPIPLSQEYVKGLINLRGQIVTLLGLRKMFGYDDESNKSYMNIIVKGKEGLYSLVVDEVTDIIEIDQEHLEECPDTINPFLKEYVQSVYKKDNGLFILLDVKKLIDLNALEQKLGQLNRVENRIQ